MYKNFSLKNKNIVITGAGGIIGQKLSQALLDTGANIALIDINEKALINLKNNLIKKEDNFFEIYKMDITDEKQVNITIGNINKRFASIFLFCHKFSNCF